MISFTDQFPIADPLVSGESSSGMLIFPWMDWDDDLLLMAYKDGVDGPGGVTRLKTSTDLGLSWSAGETIWDEGIGSGGNISVLSRGDYVATSQGYSGSTPNGVYVKRSLDHGNTWLTGVSVTGAGTYTSSGVFEVSPGVLLWPVYGAVSGHTGNVSKVLRSTDYGVTWSSPITLLPLSGGVGANEATLGRLADGTLMALVRCTDFVARRVLSTNGGLTWSSPVSSFSNCDSRIDWVKLGSGRCVFSYRDATVPNAMLGYSDDDMVTTSTPVLFHGPNKRTGYSSLIEVSPGVVLAALGEVDTGEATGRVTGRYVLDGYAVAPTGETGYRPTYLLAAGAANLAAWDTLNRSNVAVGLGSADSGHRWFEFGNGTDWHLVSGAAKNTSGATHSLTMDTGSVWAYVEADLMWQGSSSTPIGLIGKRSTVTGHAITATLESGVLKISYFDGSSYTVLNSVSLSLTAGVWNRWRLLINSNVVRVFIDEALLLSYTLNSGDHTNIDAGTRWGVLGGGNSATTYWARNVVVME